MNEFKTIDARNTFCPGPLMELITYMKQAAVGDTLELLSTDNGTASDVPEWIDCLLINGSAGLTNEICLAHGQRSSVTVD